MQNRVFLRSESGSCEPLFVYLSGAGTNECVENSPLQGRAGAHVLRMPLDAHTEGVLGMFEGFCDPVFTVGGDEQVLTRLVHRLMVHGIDLQAVLSGFVGAKMADDDKK